MTDRFNITAHAGGYAIRDAACPVDALIRDSDGEVLVYATRDLAAYYAEVIQRAVYPTLRRA